MIVNGVGHPLWALRAGGYFPGLLTAPPVAIAGLVVLRRLLAVTGQRRSATTTRSDDPATS